MNPNLLLLLSEVVLSAYPLLIKLVDVSVFFQTGLRMIIFTVCAVLSAKLTHVPIALDTILSTETVAAGIMNLLHVFTSYTAFEQLAAGNAMALFYTYPLWNIIGASVVLGETFPVQSIPWIGLALAGSVALAQPSLTNWTLIGVISALLAALTETGIYLWFKSHKNGESGDEPWTKMAQMYGSSGVLWAGIAIIIALFGLAGKQFRITGRGIGGIVLFNSIVGFLGYALRFYIIPKVSTPTFSSLSFFGIISAYLLSWFFIGEIPTLTQALGAIAIIVANTVLLNKENA